MTRYPNQLQLDRVRRLPCWSRLRKGLGASDSCSGRCGSTQRSERPRARQHCGMYLEEWSRPHQVYVTSIIGACIAYTKEQVRGVFLPEQHEGHPLRVGNPNAYLEGVTRAATCVVVASSSRRRIILSVGAPSRSVPWRVILTPC